MSDADRHEHFFQLSGDDDADSGEFRPFFKARPETDGDERFVFTEPSTERFDSQNERILQSALVKAAPEYLRAGNVDLDHLSLLGTANGMSLDEAREYEIGTPHEIIAGGSRLFLNKAGDVASETNSALAGLPLRMKARIYRGEAFAKAEKFWARLTGGARFFPSVAGDYLPGGRVCKGGQCTVSKLTWKNTGLASLPFRPVNRTVKAVSLSPLDFAKALSVSYGTDHAGFSGAAALGRESLGAPVAVLPGGDDTDPAIARYLKSLGTGRCSHVWPSAFAGSSGEVVGRIQEHFEKCEGMSAAGADHATQRTISLVQSQLHKSRNVDAAQAA